MLGPRARIANTKSCLMVVHRFPNNARDSDLGNVLPVSPVVFGYCTCFVVSLFFTAKLVISDCTVCGLIISLVYV